jgi:hypothetical protein
MILYRHISINFLSFIGQILHIAKKYKGNPINIEEKKSAKVYSEQFTEEKSRRHNSVNLNSKL